MALQTQMAMTIGAHPIQQRLPVCRASRAATTSAHSRTVLPSRGVSRGRASRSYTVQPVAFKFLKQLGLKKPDFLPDFGQEKRKAVLDRFYTKFDAATQNDILADNFTFQERAADSKTFSKQEWVHLVSEVVIPSIPDFSWTYGTDGSKNKEGLCVVKLQATGHHTGKPFTPDKKLPPLEASGKKFLLAEETQLVLVEDGKITRIEVLPVKGAGPLALYEALGGKVPSSIAA